MNARGNHPKYEMDLCLCRYDVEEDIIIALACYEVEETSDMRYSEQHRV
jgi:hypothetical protein